MERRKGLATEDEIIDSTLDLFVQMAEILLALQKQNAAFPDMKNTNWLIDNGRVVVADGKSFISSSDGYVSKRTIEVDNVGDGGIIHSKSMIAPEFGLLPSGRSFEADKMHAFLFGKNLYQYMSNASEIKLQKNKFTMRPIFNKGSGKELKTLILKLIAASTKRISMSDTIIELNRIKQQRIKQSLIEIIDNISRDYEISAGDNEIIKFKKTYYEKIEKAREETITELKREIYNMKRESNTNTNTKFKSVTMKMKLYRNGWYFKGNQKADLIEKELLKVPVEKRINFSTGEFPGLRNAMSAQRWSKNVFSKLSPAKEADETVEDKAPKIKP